MSMRDRKTEHLMKTLKTVFGHDNFRSDLQENIIDVVCKGRLAAARGTQVKYYFPHSPCQIYVRDF